MDDWMVFALKNILRFDNISSNREFSINTKKWRQNVFVWRKVDENNCCKQLHRRIQGNSKSSKLRIMNLKHSSTNSMWSSTSSHFIIENILMQRAIAQKFHFKTSYDYHNHWKIHVKHSNEALNKYKHIKKLRFYLRPHNK